MRAGPGFTLVEVMVAIAIGGLILLGGRLIVGQLSEASENAAHFARLANERSNATGLIRDLVWSLEPGSDTTPGLVGTKDVASFESWCTSPSGWPVVCEVELRIRPGRESSELLAETRPGGNLVLRRDFDRGRFIYLLGAGAGGRWLGSWHTIRTPLALGIVLDGDTLLARVGPR